MMSTMILMASIMILYSSMLSNNPIKMAMMMLLFSCASFWFLYVNKAPNLFTIVYFLLFMGGILIMFMILASLTPNQMNKKMKSSSILASIMIATWAFKSQSSTGGQETIKEIFSSSTSMLIIITILLVYFTCFMILLSSEEHTMRMYQCCSGS